MKKLFLALAVLLVLLSGCSTQDSRETQPSTTAVPTTEPTVPTTIPMADIGGTVLALDTQQLDLTEMDYEYDALISAAGELTEVTFINLGQTDLTAQQIGGIHTAYPQAQVHFSATLLGQSMSQDSVILDLSAMDPGDTDDLAALLPLMPQLQEINFVSEEGCVYDLTTIGELDKVRLAAPQATLRVRFELFGQIVTSEDERIEYYLVDIGNEGVQTVRAVLPYLTSCTYFLMDGCGVDNEVMAQLRDDFPETKIVWRIWLAGPYYGNSFLLRRASYLTDTELIRTVVITDETSHLLNYCVDTKYMDLGHNAYLSNCDFIRYMPKLEVAILALTNISDISPLANCKHLEYLEVFTTKVSDLSPLANCTELRHLNISNLPDVTDLTPLYGLENLERFRAVMNPQVPQEQFDELAARLPNCTMMMKGWDPTENGWRKDDYGNYVPRYALLRMQMEYDLWT